MEDQIRHQYLPLSHPGRVLRALCMLGCLSLVAGCSKASEPAPVEAELALVESPMLDHTHNEVVILDGPKAVEQAFASGHASFVQETPFRQVGFFYSSRALGIYAHEPLSWRVRYTDGKWSGWAPVEVTWQEEDLHVGRAILAHEALELELRGAAGLQAANVEFFAEVVANTGTLTRDLPFEKAVETREAADLFSGVEPLAGGDFHTVTQKIAPRSLVIPRSDWGARSTSCRTTHNPYRMAIHHTVAPATDGGDAARAMRGMQAYHIDTQGWCDIGYHFVVSQSAKIYQGRANETLMGAHVGNDNSGNVGICLIGNFQPGYATTSTPRESQLVAASRIVNWVHETYSIPLTRSSVKGHREHNGQTTSCPGTHLLNQIQHILDLAGNGGEPEKYEMTVAVKWIDTQNFYTQGASHNIADALPGERFKAEILIKNASSAVVRNVSGGFQILTPYLKATNYAIYSDHPAYDQSTWTLNDANEAPGNPPNTNLGASGKLTLHAFSAGETKRILVDLEATQYSIGAAESGAVVRGWIQHAESASGTVYGDQNGWDETPSTNQFGRVARGFARVDVLERDAWLFDDVADAQNLEGWTGAPAEAIAELKLNVNVGAMSLKHNAGNIELIAPDWAEINADQYDQLVLRLRSHDGAHAAAVYWGSGDGFSDARALVFNGPGNTEFNDLVIPMGTHADWAGTLTQLKIVPLLGDAPAEGASAWYDLDAIFFQSSTEQMTSAPGVEYSAAAPVEIIDPNQSNDEPLNPDPNDEQPGGDEPGDGDEPNDPNEQEDEPRMKVKSGCSTLATGTTPLSPSGIAWVVGLGALGLIARRRG